MDAYRFLRPILFKMDPEFSQHFSLNALALFHGARKPFAAACPIQQKTISVMGLTFPNRVGIAAGLDKNGDYIDALAALGVGFIEIGTVTPRPQSGNAKPRVFRLNQAEAIINRLGFNNKGVDYLIARVKAANYKGILGINIGKNSDTPIASALADYLTGFRKVYPHASYVAVNISSPNTENLRDLQHRDHLARLIEGLSSEQISLHNSHGRYVPLAVKVAPDLGQEEIADMSKLLLNYEIDGIIATNTTVSRSAVQNIVHAEEKGGLSGAPLTSQSTKIIASFKKYSEGKIPIIGVGGIMNGNHALDKIRAGANLVQIYTGLVFRGPGLVKEVRKCLADIA